MSAFVVDENTINRVVSYFVDQAHANKWTELQFSEKLGLDLVTINGRRELAQRMLDLNIDAVNARYNENTMTYPFTYCYRDEPSMIAVLKSLSCWLYQCSEGNIPESSEFYSFMREQEHQLAMSIVQALPEYDTAVWA